MPIRGVATGAARVAPAQHLDGRSAHGEPVERSGDAECLVEPKAPAASTTRNTTAAPVRTQVALERLERPISTAPGFGVATTRLAHQDSAESRRTRSRVGRRGPHSWAWRRFRSRGRPDSGTQVGLHFMMSGNPHLGRWRRAPSRSPWATTFGGVAGKGTGSSAAPSRVSHSAFLARGFRAASSSRRGRPSAPRLRPLRRLGPASSPRRRLPAAPPDRHPPLPRPPSGSPLVRPDARPATEAHRCRRGDGNDRRRRGAAPALFGVGAATASTAGEGLGAGRWRGTMMSVADRDLVGVVAGLPDVRHLGIVGLPQQLDEAAGLRAACPRCSAASAATPPDWAFRQGRPISWNAEAPCGRERATSDSA